MAKHKRAAIVTDGNDPPSAEKKRNFLEDIFRVLLHARRILSASYCIGYFIPEDLGEAVNAHETLQVGWHESEKKGCSDNFTELIKRLPNFLLGLPEQAMESLPLRFGIGGRR